MVFFEDYTCSPSGPKYLIIGTQDSKVETKLLVQDPLVGRYAETWPQFRNTFYKADWTLERNHTSNKASKVWYLEKPNLQGTNLASTLPNLGRRMIQEGLRWGDKILFEGEYHCILGYWEWTEDVLSKNGQSLNTANVRNAVFASLFTYDRSSNIVQAFCEAWCPQTNTLLTSLGEASISLWDLYTLGGLPIGGCPYEEVIPDAIELTGHDAKKDRFLPQTCFEVMNETASFKELDYGIRRLDHAVGNVPELGPAVDYIKGFTGFHEFAEFTAEDVGTAESGLNSVVLANNDETVLLPLNEPVYGTKRKSQIQTYLEHNEGAGLQHLALVTEDIFRTLREMRKRSGVGGFEFMPLPPPTYYKNLKCRAGDVLSDEQIQACEELGILVDRDDQGTLLQIFTKPVGDRPTIFIEIIQRIGCMLKDENGQVYQKGGCGGFGKGNFSELFRSIEEYEKMLEAKHVNQVAAT